MLLLVWCPGGYERPYACPKTPNSENSEKIYYIRKLSSTIEATDIDVKEFDIGKNHAVSFSYDAPYTVTNKVYSMYVKDKNINQPLDFKWLSDGAKRIFLMLTYAIVADINNLALIAFEEPENSIHPALLQNYLDKKRRPGIKND